MSSFEKKKVLWTTAFCIWVILKDQWFKSLVLNAWYANIHKHIYIRVCISYFKYLGWHVYLLLYPRRKIVQREFAHMSQEKMRPESYCSPKNLLLCGNLNVLPIVVSCTAIGGYQSVFLHHLKSV